MYKQTEFEIFIWYLSVKRNTAKNWSYVNPNEIYQNTMIILYWRNKIMETTTKIYGK